MFRDLPARSIPQPGIAVFWGDMSAGSVPSRGSQMTYQICDDRFVVSYVDLQDGDDPSWDNTATLTVFDDGTVEFDYGIVGSNDVLVGVWDGTHTDDTRIGIRDVTGYTANTATLFFDFWSTLAGTNGRLDNTVVRLEP